MSERGGSQHIPRPPGARPGDPPPWSNLALADRDISLQQIRDRLTVAGTGKRHPGEGEGPRASAVLAPIYEEAGVAQLVFTRRAQHLRTHRGEVSFPGGGEDPDDADLRATALREALEETALDPSSVEIIGELDHLKTVMGRSYIVPFVGELPGRPDLEPSPAEVEHILHVPVCDLLDPGIFHAEWWGLPGLDRPIYFFEVIGDTIWGATAAMLVNLLSIITGTEARATPGA